MLGREEVEEVLRREAEEEEVVLGFSGSLANISGTVDGRDFRIGF